MAGSTLLTLIDDIAGILDDVSAMTKVAAKKTAGVVGDDLAVNAQQVSGIKADRELPIVWAVAKGSLRNKIILAPTALLISAFISWLVIPLLLAGGLFLCFEGFEKIAPKFLHGKDKRNSKKTRIIKTNNISYEQERIKGAIRTDFILSAELIIISLSTVASQAISLQIVVLAVVSIAMTIGVYGLVAGIVKLDDAGLYLSKKRGKSLFNEIQRISGSSILKTAPSMMKGLSMVGTAAMFMVGGGIILHSVPAAEAVNHAVKNAITIVPKIGQWLKVIAPVFLQVLIGILAGAISVGLTVSWKKITSSR